MSPKTLAKLTLSYISHYLLLLILLIDKLAPNPPIVAPKLWDYDDMIYSHI